MKCNKIKLWLFYLHIISVLYIFLPSTLQIKLECSAKLTGPKGPVWTQGTAVRTHLSCRPLLFAQVTTASCLKSVALVFRPLHPKRTAVWLVSHAYHPPQTRQTLAEIQTSARYRTVQNFPFRGRVHWIRQVISEFGMR